jgi:hypothetical protein
MGAYFLKFDTIVLESKDKKYSKLEALIWSLHLYIYIYIHTHTHTLYFKHSSKIMGIEIELYLENT